MKVNYNKLKEILNDNYNDAGAMIHGTNILNNLIYDLLMRYLNEETPNDRNLYQGNTDRITSFLLDLGILENQNTTQKNIVEPFNFMTNGSTNT